MQGVAFFGEWRVASGSVGSWHLHFVRCCGLGFRVSGLGFRVQGLGFRAFRVFQHLSSAWIQRSRP